MWCFIESVHSGFISDICISIHKIEFLDTYKNVTIEIKGDFRVSENI